MNLSHNEDNEKSNEKKSRFMKNFTESLHLVKVSKWI